jgi:Tol biopolymer transport system component
MGTQRQRVAMFNRRKKSRRQVSFFIAWTLVISVLCAPKEAEGQSGNVLANAGWEDGTAPWALCGNAQIVDRQQPGVTDAMVYAGRRALRLMYSDTNRCGAPIFDPYAAAEQTFTLPANVPSVTVSFWYSRVGNPIYPVSVSLAEPGGFGYLTELDIENLPGWHQFRYELTTEQVDRVRGKTVTLELASAFSVSDNEVPDAERPGFYIDDVRVVGAKERTTEAPRPPELRGDGTQPIVYLNADLGGIARMDADGSNATKIYEGRTTPLSSAWSSRGDRIAVIEEWLTPEDTSDIKVNNAFISIIYVFDPRGGNKRELLRTAGLAGYRPTVPAPGDPERPALDVTASYVAWSPDDQAVALSICAQNRYKDGFATDPICWVELFDTATGASKGTYEPGFAPSWSRTNRILYNNDDAYQPKLTGIYEIDVSANPPTERLLVPGTGSQFNPSSYTDRSPSWSPDGTRFATVRGIDGYHYDEEGTFVSHYAIMLFDRDELLGRQLLLVDHGESPQDLTWSPDGTFMLYSLYRGNGADVWWLDTRTGATGRLTTNGASVAADWRWSCPGNKCAGGEDVTVFLPMIRR